MGKVVKRNQPCTCGSHDARQIYEAGDSFCFSCKTFFPPESGVPVIESKTEDFTKNSTLAEIKTFPIRGFKERLITNDITKFFDVRVSYTTDGEIDTHYYPYGDNAYKVRKLPKTFSWVGKSTDLFGRNKFNAGGKRLIITEGEIDAMSVAQASFDKYQKVYPVVGMSSSVMTKSLLENREWIRSFNEVVLMLDEDEAGHKARDEAIKIVGIDKVKIAKLPLKDPNEVLIKMGSQQLLQCMFDAAKYVPAGIIGKEELWDSLINYNNMPAHPYPKCLDGINKKLKGKRGGEITLFISGTGSGKSTIVREIGLDVLETTESDKLGIISLEEAPAETARKYAGMALSRNPDKEEIPIDELKVGFDKVFGSDRVILLDHQGSIDDNTIIDQLEYMCLSGCKYLLIDHITILVSEGTGDLRGNEAQDKVMNDLLRLVKRHPTVWIGLVSHLRKTQGGGKSFEEGKLPNLDDIRGSGSIKQISFDVIAFARDLNADDESERNTIKMSVLKARRTGLTGRVNDVKYSYDTGRLTALEGMMVEHVHRNKEDFTHL